MENKNIPLEYQLFILYKYRQMLCACSLKVQWSIVLESLVGRHRGENGKKCIFMGSAIDSTISDDLRRF